MPKAVDLVGVRFGYLVVIEFSHRDPKSRKRYWKVRCDCGKEKIVSGSDLKQGDTKSCGHLAKDHIATLAQRTLKGKVAHNFKDLTGETFGRLTVVKLVLAGRDINAVWEAICSCGTICQVTRDSLVSGSTKSCGCLRREVAAEVSKTHGLSGHTLHSRWKGILDRCNNPNSAAYKNYGSRGIYITDEWMGPSGFQAFYDWALVSGFSPELEIDRIDNNGPYSPWNCRWTTRKVNVRNRRITNRVIHNGEIISLAELAESKEIKLSFLYDRLYILGWELDEALELPPLTRASMKAIMRKL